MSTGTRTERTINAVSSFCEAPDTAMTKVAIQIPATRIAPARAITRFNVFMELALSPAIEWSFLIATVYHNLNPEERYDILGSALFEQGT